MRAPVSNAPLIHLLISALCISFACAFSALMLLVERQEGHLACKRYGGMVEVGTGSPDGVAPRRMVGVSASVIFPCTTKSRNSFLVPADPGGPGKRAIKRLWCGGGISFACLHGMLPHLSFFCSLFALLIFSFEDRPAPFPD